MNAKPLDPTRYKPVNAVSRALRNERPVSERALRRRTVWRRTVLIERTARAVEMLAPLPVEGETIDGWYSGKVDGIALLLAVVQLADTVEELRVCTLAINPAGTAALLAAVDDGRIRRIPRFVISHYHKSLDREVFEGLERGLRARGTEVAVERNHAKVALFHTAAGAKLVLHSSGNLRSTKSAERFSLTHDAALYDFDCRAIDDPSVIFRRDQE